ncbi:hypothetical protein KG112_11370 [Nocardioides sp. zg-ZUI104]|uniref:hypothetical protein n=1 Tax=Nocardioides faecalis TaxID=2803858 RepID=UPI001BCA703A|nr:hypothetical protein [Nocardioides faecalis]MBS4753401.1 hypothetical protein [Nocardioides faecalis]
MPLSSTAQQLLDAQVAWLMARISGDTLRDALSDDIDDLLDAATRLQVDTLADPDAVKELLRLVLRHVPPSAAASTLVGVLADRVYAGPAEPFTATDLIRREHLDALVAAALSRPDLAAKVLDKVAESPLVATLASRFLSRVLSEVLATNRAVADRIPGMGSLMNLGTSMAGNVARGVAGVPLESLLGDTAGKGASFAVRRLNKLVVETMSDPTARAAALQVFDLYADQPIGRPGAEPPVSAEELHHVAGLLQDVVIDAVAAEPVLTFIDGVVDGFFAVYGTEKLSTLVEDLGISRDDLLAQAQALVPRLLQHAVDSGEAERLIRTRLEPFYASPEVAAILGD